jgi:L-2-hydroxyglutarate oxidase LhgO
MSGREVVALERHARIGEETSSRNSEVIHAGLYYPSGSLKARLCVRGKGLLYRFCEEKGIGHRRCGKVVIAVERDQVEHLQVLHRQSIVNGVGDIEWLTGAELHRREPNVHGVAGLWSPSTGIIDSHALMLALQGDFETAGGVLAPRAEVVGAAPRSDGVELEVTNEGRSLRIRAREIVNAAGLEATRVDRLIGEPGRVPRTYYAKGNYFLLQGTSPFRHLVYPLPEPGGLGVHATIDLAGRVRFGPDVEWIDRIEYNVDPARAGAFYRAIRRYWPSLRDGALIPGYAGVRPKLAAPGTPAADFFIDGPLRVGGGTWVNLAGIESPGLTASLAIAEQVLARLDVAARGASG